MSEKVTCEICGELMRKQNGYDCDFLAFSNVKTHGIVRYYNVCNDCLSSIFSAIQSRQYPLNRVNQNWILSRVKQLINSYRCDLTKSYNRGALDALDEVESMFSHQSNLVDNLTALIKTQMYTWDIDNMARHGDRIAISLVERFGRHKCFKCKWASIVIHNLHSRGYVCCEDDYIGCSYEDGYNITREWCHHKRFEPFRKKGSEK